MLRNGFLPVPIRTGLKYPTVDKWQDISKAATPANVTAWADALANHGSTGVLCGQVVGLDLDIPDAGLCMDVEDIANTMLGVSPLRRVGMAPKALLVFRAADPAMRKLSTPPLMLGAVKVQVEALAAGEQFVAFGNHPDTGKPYTWLDGDPSTTRLADLPAVSEPALRAFLESAEQAMRAAGATVRAAACRHPATAPSPAIPPAWRHPTPRRWWPCSIACPTRSRWITTDIPGSCSVRSGASKAYRPKTPAPTMTPRRSGRRLAAGRRGIRVPPNQTHTRSGSPTIHVARRR